MRFKILGTEIYVSFFFAAIITFMLAVDRTGLIIPAIFAVITHELGHLFCMWVLDCAPRQIKLVPAAVQIVRDFNLKPSGEIAVAVCGPLVNIILFGILYFNFRAFDNEISLNYALLNLIIALFNLLPVSGLDGGTILFSLLSAKLPLNRAVLTQQIINFVFGGSVLILAVLALINGTFNPSLFIIGLYLIIMNLIKM